MKNVQDRDTKAGTMVVAQGEGRLPLQQNVKAFKAGGEEKEGRASEVYEQKRGKAGIEPIRGWQIV